MMLESLLEDTINTNGLETGVNHLSDEFIYMPFGDEEQHSRGEG